MIFYVYLAPEAVKSAHEEGSQSIQALIAVLRSLSKNCFLVDFDNYQVQNQIGDLLESLLGEYDITVLKKLLVHFSKRNLFVNCLKYDYSPDVKEIEMVIEQSEKCLIDLILLDDDSDINESPVEVATIRNYQITDFEPVRSDQATVGVTLAAASLTEDDFLEKYLKKILKYAQTLEIYDYQCGEKYKGNYEYTLRKFLGWLKTINNEDLRITFHCGFPDENQSNLFERDEFSGIDVSEIEPKKKEKLALALNAHYGKSRINIVCYDSKFAHDRFIITDQIAFSIGIGMDFFQNTGANKGKIRDISINLKNAKDVRTLVDSSK